ncbi:MAG: COX15/CtaA family protein [Alphaproteobacteria bacterium]|nr:COX15/CtaA family protein [Alphaproteobacteria bacterium]
MNSVVSAGDYANRRNIAVWLFTCAAMVALMVVIGGITRLTESGLSMTEWRPLIGWIPPLSEVEWQRVFDRYRQTSEYRIQFPGMDLEGFKTIFWWEYIHRVWGRLIGLVFGLPMAWFIIRQRVERPLIPHLVALLLLGGLQGLIGWWMVKSGFVDRDDVSQYRLTVHLGVAIVILGYLLWLALGLLQRAESRGKAPVSLRKLSQAVAGVAFVTILSGGMVAGINAGVIHNTWPLMDGGLLPGDFDALSPFWLNFFESHAAVQFDHRMLAYLTAIVAGIYWFRARTAGLEARALKSAHALGVMLVLQILLGISTLLLVVPISLAVLHQAGAVALFALAIWNMWELSRPHGAGS